MLYIKGWQMDWSVPREALTDGASSVTVAAVDIKRNSSPVVVALGGAATQPESADAGQPAPAGSHSAARSWRFATGADSAQRSP